MSGSKDFWGVLALGIVFTVLGVVGLMKHRRFRSRATRVPGVVVDVHRGLAAEYGYRYYPVLEFTTRDGQQIRTTMRLGTTPALARVGDKVTVAYDTQDPNEAAIAGTEWIQRALLWLFVLVGICCMVIALVWL